MSKKRKYQRQSATNPAQIRASHPLQRVPVLIDNGDGTSKTVMVTEAQLAAHQRRQAARVKAENEDGSESTLTVAGNAPAGNVYAEAGE